MSCYDSIMRSNQGCAIICMIAPRIQGYIWGYKCGGANRGPPTGVRCIYVIMCMCMGGERNNPSSKTLDKYNTSNPLDKHSTPIDRHNKQEVMKEVSIRKVIGVGWIH